MTMKTEPKNYKVCFRLKEKHQNLERPETIEVQESPSFFTKKEAARLTRVGNNNFKRAEHWVERRK